MAKIDLGRERGVQPTDKPLPHTVIDSNSGMAGIYSVQQANDRLAAGIQHVSDTMFSISKDMKTKQVRQESVNGQIEYFNRTQAALRDLSEKKIYNKAEYEQAYMEAMDSIDNDMRENWAKENTSWEESRTALELTMKGERSKSYAQAMGNFLREKSRRDAEVGEKNFNICIDNGNIEAAKVVLDTMALSPEQKDLWLKAGQRKIDENTLNGIINTSRYLATDESVINYAAAELRKLKDGNTVIKDDKLREELILKLNYQFDVHSNRLGKRLSDEENRQSEKARLAEQKEICARLDNITAENLTKKTREELEPLYEQKRAEIMSLKGKVPDSTLDKYIIRLKNNFENAIDSAVKNSQQVEFDNIKNTITEAIKNGGNIPDSFVQNYVRTEADKNDIKTLGNLSSGVKTTKDLAAYQERSNALFAEIYKLKNTDAESLKKHSSYVGLLISKTKALNEEDKILALKMLNNRITNEPPPNWTQHSWNAFEKNIDKRILWNDDIDKDDSTTGNLYLSFMAYLRDEIRNRGIKNETEAEAYITNHPIYKNLLGKKCAKQVDMLIRGNYAAEENPIVKWEAMPREQKEEAVRVWILQKRLAERQPNNFSLTPYYNIKVKDSDIKEYEKEKIYGER